MKIIIDRSIFQRDSYESLARELRRLSAGGSVKFCVTPDLLIETIHNLLVAPSQDVDRLIRDHYKLILDIGTHSWYQDTFEILRSELGLFPRRKDYFLRTKKFENHIKDNLRQYVEGSIPARESAESFMRGMNANVQKKQGVKTASRNIRLEPSRIKKMPGGQKVLNVMRDWDTYRNVFISPYGVSIIKQSKYYWGPFERFAIHRWRHQRDKCPYFEAFASGILFISYYAMYLNGKIDENSQPDIHNLLYLIDADAILSEDRKFMYTAWEYMYKPKGKRYLSIANLASL